MAAKLSNKIAIQKFSNKLAESSLCEFVAKLPFTQWPELNSIEFGKVERHKSQ